MKIAAQLIRVSMVSVRMYQRIVMTMMRALLIVVPTLMELLFVVMIVSKIAALQQMNVTIKMFARSIRVHSATIIQLQ
jgi:hypothetical protein